MVSQSAQQAVGAVGDQFYVTHCMTADSVLNNPGYTVRAGSLSDSDALDAALRYPPYELPIDMWRDLPPVEQAPRRLARTEHPDGGVWAVHSAYLAKDSVDRDRSYFSHLLLLPSADAAAVLRSWGSDGWAKSYPPGATKTLPGSARLPVGPLVSDATLTAFLGDSPPGPTELSVTICPQRLRTSPADRRDVFARVLQACLLLAAEEDEHRRRVYIHAEPGVVALLLYGAVRLLPQTVIENLTFSTFEPYHRNIRDYKLAEVVGTYLGPPENGKGLDTDLGTIRGIALDTIVPARSSPELRAPLAESLPSGVNDLIELVARGEWKLLPSVRHAVGADAAGLTRAGKALVRARGLARVETGDATIDELLAMQTDPFAVEELKSRAAEVWKVVKPGALDPRRGDVRAAFRDLLADPDRVKELWEEAVEAILREDFRTWDSRWLVLREVASAEAKKLLTKLVGSEKNEAKLSKLPTDVRGRLRAACGDVGLLPPRPLLVPIGLGELEPLLAGPPDCAGYTAFVLMAKDELNWLPHIPAANRVQMRKRAREFLFAAQPAALAAYVHSARPYLDTDPSFLTALFPQHSTSAANLMDRLLAAGTLESGDWLKLCTAVKLTQDKWGEYLLENDRLASLLVGLGGDGTGKDVWQGYLDCLTPALVAPELSDAEGDDAKNIHEWERKVHTHLRVAGERLTAAGTKLAPALPTGGVAKLFAANNLIKWVAEPATAERDGAEEVKLACERFGIDPLNLVEVAYRAGGYNHFDPSGEAQQFVPLIALFKTCFPVDHAAHTARRAARELIRLSQSCPANTRAAFQVRLLHACIWDGHYRALLSADERTMLQPAAVAWLSGQVNGPAKKTGPKAAAQVEAAEAMPVEEDAPVEEGDGELPDAAPVTTGKAAKKPAKKGGNKASNKGGGYVSGKRRQGGNTWLWLIILLLLLTAVVVVVMVLKNSKTEAPAPAPEPEKPKTKGK